ncbi:hypothetical protein VOLCADRAFT_108338 [Volvox carteri f. nagariensis]|uniref:MRH domain-containing protein n=1 Tax=Volvox carteri f. nagariensis TaxID=3068 RepID=D8UJK3_VOLCA|nr:uncharacterized protein VOLCADRAFT_108338 [Volvox carteri f. nagariensis]EFJ40099.1 hypothetical protein VOLCADRAFT_108338 [Volvox carteri f. nagariensis]|eukprot:XP_002958848.1 hypothetical protein VOLCADRAFT_108338 [Volvox carteri f. nagariensis]
MRAIILAVLVLHLPYRLASGLQFVLTGASRLPQHCPRIRMLGADGGDYCCSIPTKECMGRSLQSVQLMEPLQEQDMYQEDMSSSEVLPFTLLESMSALCMYRQEGLWVYEVCYRKHVRQFRQQDSSGRSEDFSCGSYSGDEHQDESVKEDTSSMSYPVRYVSHNFTGGAKCALTGEPRTAEVRFTCLPDINDNAIVSVKEFPTCNYKILVNAQALCKHKDFQLPAQLDWTIDCEPRRDSPSEEGASSSTGCGAGGTD